MKTQLIVPVKLESKSRVETAISPITLEWVWKNLADEQRAVVHRLLVQSCRQLLCREPARELG